MSGMPPEIKRFSSIARLVALTAALTLPLGACSGLALKEQRKGQLGAAEQRQLNSSLRVASASADAGQIEAAERLYMQLSRHFPNAPEPRLGRAYLALEAGDFTLAEKLFTEADERSVTPAAKAEALLGAGRASLGKGDTARARIHFAAASIPAKGTRAEAWVANGLGVAATIEGEHARARKHYDEALKLAPSHPMITANLVRALAQSGAGKEARQLYAKYPASHWLDGDGEALSRLLDEQKGTDAPSVADAQLHTALPRPRADAQPARKASEAEAAAAPSGAKVQLFSARSRARALAAWGRLASEEKELLGSLSHRVVKAEIPKRGVFYRLRAGPLADKAAAKRLCQLLKGRGRDCFVPAGKWTGGVRKVAASRPPAVAQKEPEAEAAKAPEAEAAGAPSGAKVQLFSARSRARALAAWTRLSSEEKELLGSLSHRVVKAEIPKRGVFYRLRAGPLADKAAAKRLCQLLKGRGRDCFVPAGKW